LLIDAVEICLRFTAAKNEKKLKKYAKKWVYDDSLGNALMIYSPKKVR
jgi:hypothetical protein